MSKGGQVVTPGEIVRIEKGEGETVVECVTGSLVFSMPGESVLRVRSFRGERSESRSWAVVADRSGKRECEIREDSEKAELDFGAVKVVISRRPVLMSVYDAGSELIYRDHPGSGIGWKGDGAVAGITIEPNTRFFGFGEKTGPLDKRGSAMTMWNTDMPYHASYDPLYISIPLAVVLREGRAHGLFFDNPARHHFDVGKTAGSLFMYRVEAGEIDLYLVLGPRVQDVVSRYTDLTGRMPMPPRWSLGHHQSRWSYENETRVKEVVANFRDNDVPCDAIHLDIHYMDDYKVFTVNRGRFPDLKGLAREIGGNGFKIVAIIDPGVAAREDFELYREGRRKGYFARDRKGGEYRSRVWPGKVAFPDFAQSAVREWWGDAHQALVDEGVSGIWNDMNDPSGWALDVRFRDYMLPLWPIRRPRMIHNEDGRELPHLQFRNVYGMVECESTRKGLEKFRPGRRQFVLTRSGYAGIQRSAAVWTGDNSSRFSHLALSVRMLLNLGLSGVSFAGADIGGFMWSCKPELYARWIQLGAFYPFCRTHTAIRTAIQEPCSFGPEVLAIAREYLKLRYRLHPTLYTLLRESHDTGAPALRPLFYEFQADKASAGVDDELMFGPWMLLAPVVAEGARRREVYLPPGGWIDFWTGDRTEGGRVIERDAPLQTMPVYVREGAALFLWPPLSWLDQKNPDRLYIELYPPASGASESAMYEDKGDTLDYRDGNYCWRRVSQERDGSSLKVRVEAKDGPFTPPARKLVLSARLPAAPLGATLDGRALKMDGGDGEYSLSGRRFRVELDDDFGAHELTLELKT